MEIDAVPPFAEAVRRRSIERVKALGLPLNPELPFVDEPNVRSHEDVVRRALAFHAVLRITYGAPRERVEEWVERAALHPHLSRLEAGVVDGRTPPTTAWFGGVETLWAFAWVLSMVDDLDPTRPCGDDLAKLFPDLRTLERAEKARAETRLRSVEELYAQG